MKPGSSVRTGLDRVLAGEVPLLFEKRVGLLVNPTAVDATLCHAIEGLRASVTIAALFGPEHGVRGDAQDMISVDGGRDSLTGLLVHSLYGSDEASLEPTADMLEGLDAVVFDLQDVGARYYTFVWTLLHMMRACARAGVQVVVLDRPNPIGGTQIEGGHIEPGYESFVGRMSLPNRHGLTVGEVAKMINDVEGLGCDLHVVEMQGWSREMYFDDTGLPWIAPSPNMPTLDTAIVYPGMCLVEGTELSEGRGTTQPFELCGAPFVANYKSACGLADQLAAEELPGVVFRPTVFFPNFQKHAGQRCGGIMLHVTDRRAFLPYLTGVAVVRAFKRSYPSDFTWRTRAYEFVDDKPAIDLLAGSSALREGIDRGDSLSQLQATWHAEQSAFAAARTRWLLY